MNKEIAVLIYDNLSDKWKTSDYLKKNKNLLDVVNSLKTKDIDVEFCIPKSANKFKIIMVYFTDQYDYYSFYKCVHNLDAWKVRNFKVVGLGCGLKNPYLLRKYMDYGVFSGKDGIICGLVESLINGGSYEHGNIMHFPDITNVDYEWDEKVNASEKKYLILDSGSKMNEYLNMQSFAGNIKINICGSSERLRVNCNDMITDQMIKHVIEHASITNTDIVIQNTANVPYETSNDIEFFYSLLGSVMTKNKINVVVNSRIFKPKLLTETQYYGMNLIPSWVFKNMEIIVNNKNIMCYHDPKNETSYISFMTLIVDRACTSDAEKLFHIINCSSALISLNDDNKMYVLGKNFDLLPYIKKYDRDFPITFLKNENYNKNLMDRFNDMENKFKIEGKI